MKAFNYILVLLDENGNETKRINYKSLKEIAERLNINYYQAREIYKVSENMIEKKFNHNTMDLLLKKVKIIKHPLELNLNLE